MQKVVGSNPISRFPHSYAVIERSRYSGAGAQIAREVRWGYKAQPAPASPLASEPKTSAVQLGDSPQVDEVALVGAQELGTAPWT